MRRLFSFVLQSALLCGLLMGWIAPAQAEGFTHIMMNLRFDTGLQVYWVKPLLKLTHLPKQSKGLLVVYVSEHSPAQQAGLKEGDLLLSADGEPITTAKELTLWQAKRRQLRNTAITFQVWRDDTQFSTVVQPIASYQIPDPFMQEMTAVDARIVNEIREYNTLIYRGCSVELAIKAKSRIKKAFQYKEAAAREHQHLLLAEKYHIQSKAYR